MEYSLHPKRYRFLVDNIDYFQEKLIVTEDFIRSCIQKDIFSTHEEQTILVNSVLYLNFIEEFLLSDWYHYPQNGLLIHFKRSNVHNKDLLESVVIGHIKQNQVNAQS